MNKYIGKTCPFCKTEFKEGDNIVVCSACDMPHHKECWVENQQCTTFGCLGTIKSVDGSAIIQQTKEIPDQGSNTQHAGTIYCTKCGSPNSTNYSFCSRCGNRLVTAESIQEHQVNHAQQTTQTYQTHQEQSIDDDVIKLIGTETNYYISQFQKMRVRNEKTTWNWAAFLFAPYWCMYRKMYDYGIGILGVALIITLMQAPFISFIGYIVFGIYANYIYMKHIEKLETQVKAMNEPYKTQFIMEKGGVNTTATVLAVVGYGLLNMMLFG